MCHKSKTKNGIRLRIASIILQYYSLLPPTKTNKSKSKIQKSHTNSATYTVRIYAWIYICGSIMWHWCECHTDGDAGRRIVCDDWMNMHVSQDPDNGIQQPWKTCKTQSVALMGRGQRAGGGEKLSPKLIPQLIILPKQNQRFSARVRASTAPSKSPFNFPRAAVSY